MKNLLFLFALNLFTTAFISNAQTSIQWAKCYGGYGAEIPSQIIQATDGGFIILGSTTADGGEVTGLHGLSDFWLVKTDANGILLWEKCYGGASNDYPAALDLTNDGGYILTGYTYSKNGDVTGIHDTTLGYSANNIDAWVIKIDSIGTKQWAKCYGGYKDDKFNSISHTSDGGYIMTGTTNSNDGDVSGLHEYLNDTWVVKIDSPGMIQWQKCLGGSYEELGIIGFQVSDGGYFIGSNSSSSDFDVIDNHGGSNSDYWLVKLDSSGAKKWTKSFGGAGDETLSSMVNTHDGGCLMFGTTGSVNGDVFGSHGYGDAWLVKADSLGNLEWQRCIGGSGYDQGFSVSLTSDGGYILLGMSQSQDGDVITHNSLYQFWLVKLNSSGYIQWQEFHGGTGNEYPANVIETSDDGYAFTGYVNSNGGEVSGNLNVYQDIWVVKRYPGYTEVPELISNCLSSSVFPNPFNDEATLFIESKQKYFDAVLYIYDVYGREVKRSTINQQQTIINKDDLSKGMYFYKIEITSDKNNQMTTGKFIIE